MHQVGPANAVYLLPIGVLLALIGCARPVFMTTAEELARLITPDARPTPTVSSQRDGQVERTEWEFQVGMSPVDYGDWLMARPASRFRFSRVDPAHFAISRATNGDFYRATIALSDAAVGTRVVVELSATPH